jgi:hypothetical protein
MTITLGDLSTQPLLYFPAGFLAGKDEALLVEYRQPGVKQLELRMVEPKSAARSKRYKVVRHNSGAWTSIPRQWLKDQSAKAGDLVEVVWRDATALLTLKKRAR